MNRLLLILPLFSAFSLFGQKTEELPLIPKPVSFERQKGYFLLDGSVTIVLPHEISDSLGRALTETLRLFTGLSFKPMRKSGEDSGGDPDGNPNGKPAGNKGTGAIRLDIDAAQIPEPEGYRLLVDPGHISITAHDEAGIFYAVQSLIQLLGRKEKEGGYRLASCHITDYPRFHYRGMHLDVSRHFFPVAAIRKWINVLALYKFNTFHWHLTDDQGWRIEIKKYPGLQSVSAWRDETLIGHKRFLPHRFDGKRYGGYYTQEEIREVVRYAEQRHITVIPEIEMPGHAQAVLTAYPALGCTGGPYKTATYWGVFDDVFCAGNDSVFLFLQDVLDEVMALFPSKYIHIGGDECPKSRWAVCPKCQNRMRGLGLKNEHELQSYFVQRMERYVNSKGRAIIGWDEILEGGLAPGATVMSWQGEEGGMAAARQHHSVIMAPESHLYFDYYQSLYPEEPLAAGGYTPLQKVYSYEPLAADTNKEDCQYVSGIQGQCWTEYLSTTAAVEYMLFPRAAAVAELAWSPPVRDYAGFLRRFRRQEYLLKALDIHYADNFDEINFVSGSAEAGKLRVSLSTSLPGATIRYTLDNSLPGPESAVYREPLVLQKTATPEAGTTIQMAGTSIPKAGTFILKAREYDGDNPVCRVFEKSFRLHQGIGASVSLAHQPGARFNPGAAALVNGLEGSDRYNDGQWLGFSGTDLEAVIDLGAVRRIQQIGTEVLNFHLQRMWAPVSLRFSISTDGLHYKEVFLCEEFPVNGINKVTCRFPATAARYIKVTGINKGIIPPGEYGAGAKAWLMTDEIIID